MNSFGLTQASNNLICSVGKINGDWNCFLIINETFSALLLILISGENARRFIIIPKYLTPEHFLMSSLHRKTVAFLIICHFC